VRAKVPKWKEGEIATKEFDEDALEKAVESSDFATDGFGDTLSAEYDEVEKYELKLNTAVNQWKTMHVDKAELMKKQSDTAKEISVAVGEALALEYKRTKKGPKVSRGFIFIFYVES